MPRVPKSILAATTRATGTGLGVPAALGLLLPMEAGVPIPVPADLVMLLVGERVADGRFPLWAAVIALEVVALVGTATLFLIARGPGHAVLTRLGARIGLTPERLDRASATVERRGRSALVIGRATPGVRTVTVIAAGASGLNARRAIPALAIGASVFLQLHLLLGYFLGPAARDAVDRARGPAVALFSVLVLVAAVFWIARRGRRAGASAFAEAACPLCLALGWVSERVPTLVPISAGGVTHQHESATRESGRGDLNPRP
jgi:membrane protein DedA with SNARE-associated domain